ncbi:hypothetical protein [Sphingobacterium corticibacter]|uniref:Uncharacterized protein n=1 Tax=Sphingobacterium corticibacter TaxID=2171749 RepID=A0A2T8HI71_9SPHI|nr:hypothetical protein [Sphingobacterium corticibacter]PVH25022.1 hypothetical protein DC487_08785 [Sphingobacterium corticibacter]
MDPISIYFFALASLIGLENTAIISQKATVTINATEKSFQIVQEDLFAIMINVEDSLLVADEWQKITDFQKSTNKTTVDSFAVDEILVSTDGKQLNATIKGRYTDEAVLAKAGIHFSDTAQKIFYLMDFPDWNILSSDATLNDNYWNWPSDKTVTFTMEPYKEMPAEYRKYQRSILPYWKQAQDGQSK